MAGVGRGKHLRWLALLNALAQQPRGAKGQRGTYARGRFVAPGNLGERLAQASRSVDLERRRSDLRLGLGLRSWPGARQKCRYRHDQRGPVEAWITHGMLLKGKSKDERIRRL